MDMDAEVHDVLATFYAYTPLQSQIYVNAEDLATMAFSYLERLHKEAKHSGDKHAEDSYDLARDYLQEHLPKEWR